MKHYVYLLRCADGTFYTGWTTDLDARVRTHNSGKGAKYTRSRRPAELVYYEEYAQKQEALRREYAVKQLSHAQKQGLASGALGVRGLCAKGNDRGRTAAMKYYVVDAFTDKVFKGNPAGVCLLETEISAETMQLIAFENNYAETAFLLQKDGAYQLRWFTPKVEVDLCGHATLAAAYVLMNEVTPGLNQADFETKSGILRVTRRQDSFEMDFPSRMPVPTEIDPRLEKALGCRVLEAHLSRDLLVLVESENMIQNLHADIGLLGEISKGVSLGVIVCAKGESCDFVSRFFAPNAGVEEDPVTGSAHSTLIPFWSRRLNKTEMTARQLSPRGGTLGCEDRGERVKISGKAACYLVGEIKL